MAPPVEPERAAFVHPQAGHAKKKKRPPPYYVEPITVLYIFFGATLAGAIFAPIQDCDETFNYWEPTHYLSHGYGLQTWEYSPDYAIRSWLYVAMHAIVGNVRRLLPHSTKVSEFYFVRYVLAFVCALCQTLLWKVIASTLHPRIGIIFIIATVFSPGNWHAAAAYLPSSFAMYTTMLGVAAFMNWRGGLKTSRAIAWFALGGVVGWPFAAALCLPFMLEEAVLVLFGDKDSTIDAILRVGRGVAAGLLMLFVDTCVNALFYKKFAIVPWNIVKYNIFSSAGGPDLYGTEPWTFYFRNLVLNFNVWFVLALLAGPLFLVQKLFGSKQSLVTGLRTFVFLAPFYMWLAIFSAQPHKEERFMYPMYPLLALNAAVSTHIVLVGLGHALHGRIMSSLKLSAFVLTLLLSIDIGIARVYGLWSAYSAPLRVYTPLWEDSPPGGHAQNVCFGKEWYRFPSSYFLPQDMHAKWIRSEFRGMLPGEFSEAARTGFGFRRGTWLPTSGLNNRNEEDMGKYVDLRTCHYLVDTQYHPENTEKESLPPNEPDFVADEDHWEVVKCVPFMDASRTPALARILWVPDWPFVPEGLGRKWGKHCLLKQKATA